MQKLSVLKSVSDLFFLWSNKALITNTHPTFDSEMKEPLGVFNSLQIDAFSTLHIVYFEECFNSYIRLSASRNCDNQAIPLCSYKYLSRFN